MLPLLDKKCPVVVNGHPCGLPIVRTGTLGELDVYECPQGHRTTLAAKKEEAKIRRLRPGPRKLTKIRSSGSTNKRRSQCCSEIIRSCPAMDFGIGPRSGFGLTEVTNSNSQRAK